MGAAEEARRRFGLVRVGEDERDSAGVLRTGTCFEMPELSASIIVDKSSESGGPGEGVRNILTPKVKAVNARV